MNSVIAGLAGETALRRRPSELDQHLLYEIARGVHRYVPTAEPALRALSWLSENAVPTIRMLSVTQLVAHAVRVGRDVPSAQRHRARGDQTLQHLADTEGTVLPALIRSRFHRVAALADWASGVSPSASLGLAERAHAELDHAATTNTERQLAAENRKILLEAALKAGPTENTEQQILELIDLDPADPDSLLFCGDARLKQGRIEDAIALYIRAGNLVTTAAALGHYRAAQCLEYLGRPTEAAAAYASALALDPAAVEPRARAAALR
jgi:hypothetical protein